MGHVLFGSRGEAVPETILRVDMEKDGGPDGGRDAYFPGR
jgi:hypothetical protein